VNVTGACRRRRNFEFIDKPEILIFDEDIEDDIDVTLRNVFRSSSQFLPTKTLG
jgi:hypothetical protein